MRNVELKVSSTFHQCTEYKLSTFTFSTHALSQQSYFGDFIYSFSTTNAMRSSNKNLLPVPLMRTTSGRRSFAFAALTI